MIGPGPEHKVAEALQLEFPLRGGSSLLFGFNFRNVCAFGQAGEGLQHYCLFSVKSGSGGFGSGSAFRKAGKGRQDYGLLRVRCGRLNFNLVPGRLGRALRRLRLGHPYAVEDGRHLVEQAVEIREYVVY